jgi:superfamily I DNA/RNA helicase
MRGWPVSLGLEPMHGVVDEAAEGVGLQQRADRRPAYLSAESVERVEDGVWAIGVTGMGHADPQTTAAGARAVRDVFVSGDEGGLWSADVLHAEPGRLFVHVPDDDGDPPVVGAFQVHPYDFARALKRVYGREGQPVHRQLSAALNASLGRGPCERLPVPPGVLASWSYAWSTVWGPPGTGKTYTLVDQVTRLLAHTNERVLIVSTTNRATDEVALRLGARLRDQGLPAGWVRRYGRSHDARQYLDQELASLLPVPRDVIEHLVSVEDSLASAEGLERASAQRHATSARRKVPSLSQKLWDDRVRCAVTTLHQAVTALSGKGAVQQIAEGRAPFTTVIVDEAGLVSRAVAAAVSLLAAGRVVLVGDPEQLAPIASAARTMPTAVVRWVAQSALDHLSVAGATPRGHRLDVQYRMHADIRHVVSGLSYDDRLSDAPRVATRGWRSGRLQELPRAIWYCLDEHRGGTGAAVASERGPRGRSRRRPLSRAVLSDLVAHHPELRTADVLFVSPFRQQVADLRAWCDEHGLAWRVSTVHAQQGSEADVVLFDTVHAGSTGWDGREWRRLVNVGLSRARHLAVVLASREEMSQPWLGVVRDRLAQMALVPSRGALRWERFDQTLSLLAAEPEAEAPAPAAEEPPRPTDPRLGAQIARMRALRPVLSHEQAALVGRDLSDAGPRLVRGVAGSGKTLVLAHWAARLLDGFGLQRAVVVFGNKALEPLLKRLLEDAWHQRPGRRRPFPWERLSLLHIRDLLAELRKRHGLDKVTPDYDYPAEARQLLDEAPLAPLYDAILVDEAQDLGTDPLELLVRLVQPTESGRKPLLVFYDNAQDVYSRGTPTWSHLGLDLRGRSDVMKESFRGTRANTEFALTLLDAMRPIAEGRDFKELIDAELLVHTDRGWQARFCAVRGKAPQCAVFRDRSEEVTEACRRIRRWITEDAVRPEDITVVALSKRVRNAMEAELKRALHGVAGVRHRTTQGFEGRTGCVVVTTPQSFKGYDSEIVVVPAIDRFVQQGRLLHAVTYVALTRARTLLYASATGGVPGVTERLVDALARLRERR